MACCLMAPNHYLNQCGLIISEVFRHSPEGSFEGNAQRSLIWVWKLLIQDHSCISQGWTIWRSIVCRHMVPPFCLFGDTWFPSWGHLWPVSGCWKGKEPSAVVAIGNHPIMPSSLSKTKNPEEGAKTTTGERQQRMVIFILGLTKKQQKKNNFQLSFLSKNSFDFYYQFSQVLCGSHLVLI